MALSNTPSNQLKTPKQIYKTRLLAETPDCFKRVEIPASSNKKKIIKENADEVSNLTVAVRVRPMNWNELSHVGSELVVHADDNELFVRSTPIGAVGIGNDHLFQYDHVFWSCDVSHPKYCSQEDVFRALGKPLLAKAFMGYNACLFAYGQTGSGKTYSMMAPESRIDLYDKVGIIPRFCRELFKKISELPSTHESTVEISYYEIYNEKIHDLLSPDYSGKVRKERTALKVREHPVWGPYVVDLSVHPVKSYEEVHSLLLLGIKNRATAATVMNEKSSRSHSIFSIELTLSETTQEKHTGKRSKVSLVDLAGSERLGSSYSCDEKIKQGVSINKSLLTLGKVITALADQRKPNQFVPYRESILTWLLRESLGGNSQTTMLATISPSNNYLDETLSTLRYACQARSIVNRAKINEDPNDKLIRELKAEVERLRARRCGFEMTTNTTSTLEHDQEELNKLKHQLRETEEKLFQAEKSWEAHLKEIKERQMKELAEFEHEKEVLESNVRVLSIANSYNVEIKPPKSDFLEKIENILFSDDDEKEEKRRFSKSEVYKPLNEIYNALDELYSITKGDENTKRAFNKFYKSFRIFQSALENKSNENCNEQKGVCFRL